MSLSNKQQNQIQKQIAAYENKPEKEEVGLHIVGRNFTLEVDPFVASPSIMNSGIQAMNFLAERPELVKGRTVNDMGTGSGILGITAALLGATKVYMEDVDAQAIVNTQNNIHKLGLENICEGFVSDLFSEYGNREKAQVQIFNHPFFSEEPVPGKDWTRMMLGGTELLKEYFRQAPNYSTPDALYIFSWMKLAEDEQGLGNNPSVRGREFGFETVEIVQQNPVAIGVQQEPFEIHILRKITDEN